MLSLIDCRCFTSDYHWHERTKINADDWKSIDRLHQKLHFFKAFHFAFFVYYNFRVNFMFETSPAHWVLRNNKSNRLNMCFSIQKTINKAISTKKRFFFRSFLLWLNCLYWKMCAPLSLLISEWFFFCRAYETSVMIVIVLEAISVTSKLIWIFSAISCCHVIGHYTKGWTFLTRKNQPNRNRAKKKK